MGLPHASPSVRKFARELGVPLAEVKGSGLKGRITEADVQAFTQAVMSGAMDIVIAAGVESMTRVPMFSPSALASKAGMGSYQSDWVNQRYNNVAFSQFVGAEMMARKYGLSKDELDRYALLSHQRALAATQAPSAGRGLLLYLSRISAARACPCRPSPCASTLAMRPIAMRRRSSSNRSLSCGR